MSHAVFHLFAFDGSDWPRRSERSPRVRGAPDCRCADAESCGDAEMRRCEPNTKRHFVSLAVDDRTIFQRQPETP